MIKLVTGKILPAFAVAAFLCVSVNSYADTAPASTSTSDNSPLKQLQEQIVQVQKQMTDQMQTLQDQLSKNTSSDVDQLQKQIHQVQQECSTNITTVQDQIKQAQKALQAEIDTIQKEVQDLTNKAH